MKAIVFANGDLCSPPAESVTAGAALLIAADGGSRHLVNRSSLPDVLIGDLDSTPAATAAAWEKQGVKIIRYPEDKDQTDLELALQYAVQEGADQVLVYGAVGGRLDMTLANLLLLAHPVFRTDLTFLYGNQEVQLVRPDRALTLHGSPGDRVSLIPLEPETTGVSTENLQYPLREETLAFGRSRGISNLMVEEQAAVSLHQGLLLVIHTRSPFKENHPHD